MKERNLVLGMYQLDGFRESEMPLDILAKLRKDPEPGLGESMFLSWIHRGFGSFIALEPKGKNRFG